ncbi:MAG: short-chain dehydrogenase [Acidimicrobiaceae bacterium]|nr:short-chain dehydrogenase [Acidimicrobiaceae bacterium]
MTSAVADVARRSDVDEFARHVAAEFRTDAVHLLFNNAGTTGGHSIVRGAEANWDRTFDVVWGGVLNGTRAFFPLLEAAQRSQVVNIASINATWGCLGAQGPHTAYCTAKFAVRGFTEALIVDFRVNAPHVTAAVVLPGHVATPIARRALESAGSESGRISDEYVARTRQSYASRGRVVDSLSDDDVRTLIMERIERFEQSAPTSAAEAATAILQGVRDGEWRIVVGPDAHAIDEAVRANPTAAYSQEFTDALTAKGHFVALVEPR